MNAAETDKTGPEPHGATETLRLITHGRCECDLCAARQHAKTHRSQP